MANAEQDDAKVVHPVTMFGNDPFAGDNRAMKILPPDHEGGPKPGEDGMQPHPRYSRKAEQKSGLHAVPDENNEGQHGESDEQEGAPSREPGGSEQPPAPPDPTPATDDPKDEGKDTGAPAKR